jgi:fluoride ion exporter CrcB/FEX
VILIALYVVCTVLVIVLPVVFDWVHLTYTATFGAVGAYLRYLLSFLNPKIKDFPIGTFIANVLGSWLIALWTMLAKFEVPYHRHDYNAVLYGLSAGFCGCLTTISTFVNEIDVLPRKRMYLYGLSSFIAAQVGIILIFDIYAYKVVDDDEVMPDTMDFCKSYHDLCTDLLAHLECPDEYSTAISCTDGDDMDSFDGQCVCGTLDASLRMAELLIDAQSKYNVTQSFVAVWPYEYDDYDHPTESWDLCISFENLCQHFLDRIDCPSDQQVSNGCDRGSILDYKGECECGEMKYSSTRVAELLIDTALFRRYDMLPYGGYPALEPINYCAAYEDVCGQLMDHVMCPDGHRHNNGCEDVNDPYATWIGQCSCGTDYDIGDDRVGEDILDALVKPHWWNLVIPSSSGLPGKFDGCATYEALCIFFLDVIGCSEDLRDVAACDGGVENFIGDCACGEMDISSDRMRELVFDGCLAQDLVEYLYIPPPVAPYTMVAQSNPYKPLETDNIVK